MDERPKRLVIFDVDGTLVDSQDAIVAAMSEAFQEQGLPLPARAEMLSIVGLSLPEAFRTLVPEAGPHQIERLTTGYKAGFVRLRQRGAAEAAAPMFDGARDLIMDLRGQGYALGVATGKARRGVDHFVETHGLEGCFSAIQTADDAPSKPHPGMVLNCLELAGIDARNAVIVGDTEFDMAMGAAAGVRCIGVGWGYHPIERVQRGGAQQIAHDIADLSAIIARIW